MKIPSEGADIQFVLCAEKVKTCQDSISLSSPFKHNSMRWGLEEDQFQQG